MVHTPFVRYHVPLTTVEESKPIRTLFDFKKSEPVLRQKPITVWKGTSQEKATRNSLLKPLLPPAKSNTKHRRLVTVSLESNLILAQRADEINMERHRSRLEMIKKSNGNYSTLSHKGPVIKAPGKLSTNAANLTNLSWHEHSKESHIKDNLRKREEEANKIYTENLALLKRIESLQSVYHKDWIEEDSRWIKMLKSISRFPEAYKEFPAKPKPSGNTEVENESESRGRQLNRA